MCELQRGKDHFNDALAAAEQARKLDPSDGAECLRRFKANQITGLLLTGAFLLGAL